MHIFSIFGRLYHINSETDMHIFSIFGRMYHINSQIFVYAFAPSRVLFDVPGGKFVKKCSYRYLRSLVRTDKLDS
jgi:hypothetical protein